MIIQLLAGLRGGGWTRFRFPMELLEFRLHYGSGIDSASNRNDYQGYLLQGKGGRCEGLTNLPSLYADFVEILGASTSWSPEGLSRPVQR
jgi:hypothetical protein